MKDWNAIAKFKIVLWGAGEFGSRILDRIANHVVAIIDNNPSLRGTYIDGIPIISYEDYERDYNNLFILVTPLVNRDIVHFLINEKGNHKFFEVNDLPGEWLDYNDRTEYRDYLYSIIETAKNAYVYGCNFHAVLLALLLKERLGDTVFLVANKSERKELISEVSKNFCEVIDINEAVTRGADTFYIATGDDLDEIEHLNINKIETWDCRDLIEAYHHPELLKYKDLYKGKRCFIIGNGPSLDAKDLTKLYEHNEISFGVNKIYNVFRNTKWRPDYYVTHDIKWTRTREFIDNINEDEYKAIFITDRLKQEFYKNIPYDVYHVQAQAPYKRDVKFSRDLVNGLYDGATVVYICMQIAAYMGFSEIYLLGVDFTGGKDCEKKAYSHFYNKNENAGCLYNRGMYLGFLAAMKEEQKGDFRIYNATRGGELEVFERRNFDDLF